MSTRRFEFAGPSGDTLAGRLESPEGAPRAWALFAHCFTCTKDSLAAARVSRGLAARGVGVLRFDFTGLGDSDGAFADGGFGRDVADLIAATQAMSNEGIAPTLLVGHSLGGAAVLAAAGVAPEIKAVAVIGAPFDPAHVLGQLGDSIRQIMETGEGEVLLGGRSFTLRRAFVDELRAQAPGERIAKLHKALLVLHSPQDAEVDVDNASAIFAAARHPKSFVSLNRADHFLSRAADADYAAAVIAAWASPYIGPPPPVATPEPGLVSVEDTGPGQFQVRVSAGGEVFLVDEPIAVGGSGSGPTPFDLLSAALGACTVMTLRLYADKKGWPVTRLRAEVSHLRGKGPGPADRFVRHITIEGGVDAAQRRRLIEIAGRCPVHRTLEGGARIDTLDASLIRVDPAGHMQRMRESCED